MKKRKKLIKRIGAVLCALVVAVSSFGVSVPYYAITNEDCIEQHSVFVDMLNRSLKPLPEGAVYPASKNGYEYCAIFQGARGSSYYYFVVYSPTPIVLTTYFSGSINSNYYALSCEPLDYPEVYKSYSLSDSVWQNGGWEDALKYTNGMCLNIQMDVYKNTAEPTEQFSNYSYRLMYTNHDLLCSNGQVLIRKGLISPDSYIYSSQLGYLQNVTRKSTYIRGDLYNYDNDSLTYHWYHDLTSTSGVDLSNGNYNVRHYISNATVKGYEQSDIVEMSEKYLMAEYDASQGYFSYLQKDYLDKIESLGYIEPSWIDVYLKGYFTLQHHYLQIVNTSTNEVGGYLHFYPKDASGDSFGVEMEYEGLDDNFQVDENAPSGFIDTPNGSGTTVEDALENADEPKLDDLGGIEPLIENLEGYAGQITNVSSGIGALLSLLPGWMLGLFGLSVALIFVVIAVKSLRG